MEIILVSDTHGRSEILHRISSMYPHADAYIHCGDVEDTPEAIAPFVAVCGNNDNYHDFPIERVLDIKGKRVFMTHSHVFHSLDHLVSRAKAHRCTLACYGHTHRIDDHVSNGIRVLNPGSLAMNRDGNPCAFMRITDTNDELIVEIIPVHLIP